MRILFITHRLPCPPDRGCKVRSAALLHGLARRHEVWCAGFLDAGGAAELQAEAHASMTALRHLCGGFLALPFRSTLAGYRALGGLITGGTATENYFCSRGLREGVMAWSREIGFDAVFAFSSGMAPLALAAAARRRVLCMDDLDSRKWADLAAQARWPMKLIYATESRRLANRECQWLSSFDATIVVTPREADLITDPELRRKIVVIPPILPPIPDFEEPPTPVSETGPVVGFVGAMDYEPNVDAARWLARDIWPRIRRQCPGARLTLVGRSPTPAVRELERDDSIEVTGTVPSVNSHLAGMRVHVAPLRISRGVQIKVLAAMSAGRPCVVTSCVAEGLAARPGRDLIVADSPGVFAAAVVDLLEHPDKAEAIGRAGQRFVRELDPDRAISRVEALLAGENERLEIDPERPTERGRTGRKQAALVSR